MNMAEKRDRPVTVMFTKEELDKIDDFRFAERAFSRAAVVRELIEVGLAAQQKQAQA
ncbi:hypothetical protein [Pseudosulfitobacter pseudonitzschiae]|uniref:hypothetical protein n=1 Tax=Pseudosulfitobacter pseudonitzschiae TaxID=1402135 RepID=UPI001AF2565A|nr:hypothetical protein [Pseudosulfitobacter pseudonitzschiae]MBM1817164.1 hypothetical protein [Pseudosulfitobacter pseudonitzschiae]MBM1834167.1 hypothetical protein [Pseudosulfitobacter pseudonitzschiae]MBM1839032.1 hypothetical protein [Pseudosulfitobacter pseudonitzschiae]MBM1843882.1 hypothetical protein [Pseudosulfitobacter pseudonitzschiae]MBM1848727.1 hypothetical protein [Pseudosulfitobacter pseudonitzschiae]